MSVLLAGSPPELIMLGVNGDEIAADPAKVRAKLSAAPAVAVELRTIFVDDLDDLLGTFRRVGGDAAASHRSRPADH